eukprot:gene20469-27258_t
MMDIPVQQLLDQLVEQRREVSDHDPELSRLDGMIISLMTITRKMFSAGPYDIIHGSPPSSPEAPEGSMLQDLKEINLWEEASGLLEVEYLSTAVPVVVGGEWPVHGVLYGPCKRPLVCLPTQLRPNLPCINVFYLVDTGAPTCELSPAAFSALGADAGPPRATRATINGVHCHVHLCAQDGNHPDIPVLGADFLTMMGAVLTVTLQAQHRLPLPCRLVVHGFEDVKIVHIDL